MAKPSTRRAQASIRQHTGTRLPKKELMLQVKRNSAHWMRNTCSETPQPGLEPRSRCCFHARPGATRPAASACVPVPEGLNALTCGKDGHLRRDWRGEVLPPSWPASPDSPAARLRTASRSPGRTLPAASRAFVPVQVSVSLLRGQCPALQVKGTHPPRHAGAGRIRSGTRAKPRDGGPHDAAP